MILTILQARTSSSRLPGKVLAPILGAPMLARQVERMRRSRRMGLLVLATSADTADDPLEALSGQLGLPCHRGPLHDVLARFGQALDRFGPADHVMRMTGDCPLADPDVMDEVIDLHLTSGADYTHNTAQPTYPKGLDVELVRAPLLARAAAEATDPYEREHVTPRFYRSVGFKVAGLARDPPLGDLRWTVDTAEDLAFVRAVYEALYPAKPDFSSQDILDLTRDWPERGREG